MSRCRKLQDEVFSYIKSNPFQFQLVHHQQDELRMQQEAHQQEMASFQQQAIAMMQQQQAAEMLQAQQFQAFLQQQAQPSVLPSAPPLTGMIPATMPVPTTPGHSVTVQPEAIEDDSDNDWVWTPNYSQRVRRQRGENVDSRDL